MDRKELAQKVFEMVKEDIVATDQEIWDSIAITSDDELKKFYRRLKRYRRYMDE